MSDKNPNLITHNIRCPCCGITVRRHIPEWEQALMRGERESSHEHPVVLRLSTDSWTIYPVDAETGERLQGASLI